MESVWIVYKVLTFNQGRVVKGILKTRDEAYKFAEKLKDKLDPMFGIDIQEWIIDTVN